MSIYHEMYGDVGSVCSDCATKAGFTPKDKVVGMWIGECGICHKQKSVCSLWHDYNPPNKGDK